MAPGSRLVLRGFRPLRKNQKTRAPQFIQAWPRLGSEILTAEDHPGRSEARGHTAGGAGEPGPHQVHPGGSGVPEGLRQTQPTAASSAEGGVRSGRKIRRASKFTIDRRTSEMTLIHKAKLPAMASDLKIAIGYVDRKST